MNYGEKIKEIRESLNINQLDFAKKLNISSTTLSSYETNRTVPGVDFLKKICDIFGVSPSWFLDIETKPKPQTYKDIINAFLILDNIDVVEYNFYNDVLCEDRKHLENSNVIQYFLLLFNDEIFNAFLTEYFYLQRFKGSENDKYYKILLDRLLTEYSKYPFIKLPNAKQTQENVLKHFKEVQKVLNAKL